MPCAEAYESNGEAGFYGEWVEPSEPEEEVLPNTEQKTLPTGANERGSLPRTGEASSKMMYSLGSMTLLSASVIFLRLKFTKEKDRGIWK